MGIDWKMRWKVDNDFKRLIKFLTLAGVQYKIDARLSKDKQFKTVYIEEGYKKVGGYSCFYNNYNFDEEGNLINIEIYE